MGRPSDARKRLIEAAKKVIYAHSYEAVTVDELCAAAGVTKSKISCSWPLRASGSGLKRRS
jgi:AcrR family transcriptional regulator